MTALPGCYWAFRTTRRVIGSVRHGRRLGAGLALAIVPAVVIGIVSSGGLT
jgi:hypothetical protein